tara:strand:- start:1887 stop:2093 length:207 start_codon:yes stop_codon:yes gene_type:complete
MIVRKKDRHFFLNWIDVSTSHSSIAESTKAQSLRNAITQLAAQYVRRGRNVWKEHLPHPKKVSAKINT